ncbi:hypothetical protein HU200_049067 [Digitaria exilis]|uniref:UDP-glycosyltransferase n=1 Tax=Digitaria exilis TaxID=1010633 RepID=A0A835AU87_9POAL|nr:hypothetical protein HU200_049067 [Digitaria exilis]
MLSYSDDCVIWLYSREVRSVVYVSLEMHAGMSYEQLTQTLHGLVKSEYYFLWVALPDMVQKLNSQLLQEEAFTAADRNRALILECAPQHAMLCRHQAVGCFLTHGEWSSALEAAVKGVPMVCFPFFPYQKINSHLVSQVWKTGRDMNDDVCVDIDNKVEGTVTMKDKVKDAVITAMKSGDLRNNADTVAQLLKDDFRDVEGQSSSELNGLLNFIMDLRGQDPAGANRELETSACFMKLVYTVFYDIFYTRFTFLVIFIFLLYHLVPVFFPQIL